MYAYSNYYTMLITGMVISGIVCYIAPSNIQVSKICIRIISKQ